MATSSSRKSSFDTQAGASSLSTSRYHPYASRRNLGNVTKLVLWREVAPVFRQGFKKIWGDSARCKRNNEAVSAKHALTAWLEAESLRHCTAKYCPLQPAPRSTIAAAFSPDGAILASTHGDHTVKLICCKTGLCLKTLFGHRRTPWVVRFHPNRSDILASGSLDNEVKIWNANNAECIASHDFYRPIASIAFHAQGNLLAVASGHKLYIWQYNRWEEDVASPTIVLRTRRSLRAVHFHPHGAPLLLTAEVNGLDAPDCPMTVATSAGYPQYPRPAIFLTPIQQPATDSGQSGNVNAANGEHSFPSSTWIWPAWVTDNEIEPGQGNIMDLSDLHHVQVTGTDTFLANGREGVHVTGIGSEVVPMDVSPRPAQTDLPSFLSASGEASNQSPYVVEDTSNMESGVDMLLRAAEGQELADGSGSGNPVTFIPEDNGSLPRVLPRTETRDSLLGAHLSSHSQERQIEGINLWSTAVDGSNLNVQVLVGDNVPPVLQPPFHVAGDSPGWELPFFQGWVMGQTQADLVQPNTIHNQHGIFVVPNIPVEARGLQHLQELQNGNQNRLSTTGRNGSRPVNTRGSFTRGVVQRGSLNCGPVGATSVHVGILHGFTSRDPNLGVISAGTSSQFSMAAAAELPCTVKLKIWPHDINAPSAVLDPEKCRLVIPHAVLCSEMGAHFSPCGRFLAACVACALPPVDSDASFYLRPHLTETTSAGTSPTRHPISAQQVIYELRVYSLEEATFGQVLASRAIRAAHCLTSIQFSPASDHILLAYGRRHSSLLRSIVVNGTTTIPIFTILEVYRVSDMELVKVLPSAEDEVNVACFHPVVGGGLAYGTKEGRLRIFRHERSDKGSGSYRTFEDHVFDGG